MTHLAGLGILQQVPQSGPDSAQQVGAKVFLIRLKAATATLDWQTFSSALSASILSSSTTLLAVTVGG
jgi:hypothetical protein